MERCAPATPIHEQDAEKKPLAGHAKDPPAKRANIDSPQRGDSAQPSTGVFQQPNSFITELN